MRRADLTRRPGDISSSATAAKLDVTALFVDLRQPTGLADAFRARAAARLFRSYASGAISIVKGNSGRVQSVGSEGLSALFLGSAQADEAAKAAMQINWYVQKMLSPKFDSYVELNRAGSGVRQALSVGIGLDSGRVSTGRHTDTAAKLSEVLRPPDSIGVTREVYAKLHANRRFSDGLHMWSDETIDEFGGVARAYRTTSSWWRVT